MTSWQRNEVRKMLTLKEGNEKAKAMMSGYKYLYGAKGQLYTKQLVETLAKQYKSNYTKTIKAEALKDADKGFRAGDCSFFVCSVMGLEMINSTAIKQKAVKLLNVEKANARVGMALWKQGHIAYIGPNLDVYEFKSTKEDARCTPFDKRAKDFTYMFVVKGSPLYFEEQIGALNNVSIYYPKYTGKSSSIVSALASVGEKDTSFNHRRLIARKNGYAYYEGSIRQNLDLVNLLKKGRLIKA